MEALRKTAPVEDDGKSERLLEMPGSKGSHRSAICDPQSLPLMAGDPSSAGMRADQGFRPAEAGVADGGLDGQRGEALEEMLAGRA
jgi:hypothetical protein